MLAREIRGAPASREREAGIALLLAFGALAVLLARPTVAAADEPLHVCSITINSDDEIKAFRRRLPASDFDFVELTDLAAESPEDGFSSWLDGACRSGVVCDVLVVSGHFANAYLGSLGTTFAGRSGLTLSLDELDRRSCEQSCPGILNRPREVFLFGCRTLEESLGPPTLPKSDRALLSELGVPVSLAETVLDELRHRGEDTSNRNRMRFAFAGVPHIYGFAGGAPTGEQGEPRLDGYLRAQGDYAKRLRAIRRPRLGESVAPNRALARAIRPSTLTESHGFDADDPEYRRAMRMCPLTDETRPLDQRMARLEELVDEPRFVSYLPAIATLVRRHPPPTLAADERSVLDRILAKEESRRIGTALARGLRTPLLRVEMTRVAQGFGWIDAEESRRIQRDVVLQLLRPPTYGEGRDIVCGLDPDVLRRLDVRAADVPAGAYEDEFAIQALACLRPADEEIERRLAEALSDPRGWLALLATQALGAMRPGAIDAQIALARELARHEEAPRAEAGRVLRDLQPTDPRVLAAIRESDPSFVIDWR